MGHFRVLFCAFVVAAVGAIPTASLGATLDLLYESDADRGDGFEFFLRSFATTGDLLTGTGSSGGYSALDLTPDYSVAGMTYDEDGLHVLYESDADRSDGFEFFLRTFASAEDLLSGVGSSGGYSELDLTSDYSVSGMAYGPWETTPTIPLPASAWLLFCGVAGFGALRRNRA